jgi:hypothetical protein
MTAREEKSAIAQELLVLERRYQQGALTSRDEARVNELAAELFGQEEFNLRRKSYRLPCDRSAVVDVGGRTFPCGLVEVSHIGLTIAGEALPVTGNDVQLTVASVDVDGQKIALELRCRVVRSGRARGGYFIGVEIAQGNSPAVEARYFQDVYYPLYLDYLENVAQSFPSTSDP